MKQIIMIQSRHQRRPQHHHLVFLLSLLLLALLPSPSQSFAARTAALPEIRLANLPSDLPAIQDCRRSAYAGKPVNLPAAKSFCNADQITKPNYLCIVAKDKKTGSIVGTADLNTKNGVVNNVYVREEARKRGIARRMMEAVEDALFAAGDNDGGTTIKLKLTVMSKNVPAVTLYKNMGFVAPGVYGGLDALSSVSPLNFLMEMEKTLG